MIRVLLFAAAISVAPTTADAGKHCGGGGGGTSGGGTSDGGTRDHRSTTSREVSFTDASPTTEPAATTTATGCIDDTDVVGYRKCTKFGAWGGNLRVPRMFVELGTNVRQFTSALGTHTGAVTHGSEGFTYRMVMPESSAGADTAMTSVLRVSTGFRHGLYAGVEGELGGISAPRGATIEMTSAGAFGTPSLDPSTGLYVAAAGLAGVRNTSRRGVIALEGAGGVRSARYRFASQYHNCEETSTISITSGVIEARARAELFLGPWITLGGTLGTSLLDRNDWLAGVYVGVHSRAFGGGR